MAKTFREYSPDQLLLLAPSLREWLPEDHSVYFVSDLVETLDLSAIYASYDEERGYPPYHPLLMTKLLVYGYTRGVGSSRKLERACLEAVDFRILGQVNSRTTGRSPRSGRDIWRRWAGCFSRCWSFAERRGW